MFLCSRISFGGNPVQLMITANVLGQISTKISMYPGVVSICLVDELINKRKKEGIGKKWIARVTTFENKHLILHKFLGFLSCIFPLKGWYYLYNKKQQHFSAELFFQWGWLNRNKEDLDQHECVWNPSLGFENKNCHQERKKSRDLPL